MKYLSIVIFFALASCDSHSFERDKRQIIAKDEVRRQLRGFRNYTITAFKEDTLKTWTDSVIAHPIRYTLDLVYDSARVSQGKTASVIFTAEGNSILRSEISDRPLTEK